MKKIHKFQKELVCCLCCAMALGGMLRFTPAAKQYPKEETSVVEDASPVGEDENTSKYDEPEEKEEDFSV